MNKTTKILSSIIALSLAGLTYAADNSAVIATNPTMSPAGGHHLQQFHQRDHRHGNFSKSWYRGLHRLHPLTTAEAKTVAEASVILYGDSSMKVGTVTPFQGKHSRQNYNVQITNQQGQNIGTVVMNGSNGRVMKIKHQSE